MFRTCSINMKLFLCDGNHLPIVFLPFYVSLLRGKFAEDLGRNSKSEFSWILCCRELILHTRLLEKRKRTLGSTILRICAVVVNVGEAEEK